LNERHGIRPNHIGRSEIGFANGDGCAVLRQIDLRNFGLDLNRCARRSCRGDNYGRRQWRRPGGAGDRSGRGEPGREARMWAFASAMLPTRDGMALG
jgi:hypothetical protein